MYFNYPVCCWLIPICRPVHIDITTYTFIGQLNHMLSENAVSPKQIDVSSMIRHDLPKFPNQNSHGGVPMDKPGAGALQPRGQLRQNHRLQAATEAATDTSLAGAIKRSRSLSNEVLHCSSYSSHLLP